MRVLVLCHGNVNRSAFCAALIRRARPTWFVESAGLHTRDGRPATPKARRAAAERGMSLDAHRSTQVTLDQVSRADIVLYMDGGNEKRLRRLIEGRWFTTIFPRCYLLAKYGCLRRLGDPNYVSDPVVLSEMWAAQEFCVRKFLEAHS